MNSFISHFNWKKAQENIEKKISTEDSTYNPWLIDSQRLLENLCYGNFKATYLNITGCADIPLKQLFPNEELKIMSPFIPENSKLKSAQQISIKKESPTLLSDGKNLGAIITVSSSKKVSKEIIYLPIYIEEI